MSREFFQRTELLLGRENMEKISGTGVIIFGVGGVGSWCAESLVRSGIGRLTIVDSDRVCATNINRQLQATSATVGKVKVHELRKRLLEINPGADIDARQEIYSPENRDSFQLRDYHFIVDAIDSLGNKIDLIETALKSGNFLVSSMGAALKMDPSRIKIDSIWKTRGCPLARRIRGALRKKGITGDFPCVYSEEVLPMRGEASRCGTGSCICPKNGNGPGDPLLADHEWCSGKAQINGSIAHITAIFGFMLAGIVINRICGVG